MMTRFLFMLTLLASLNLPSNFFLPNKKFFRFTENEIDKLLPNLCKRYPDFHDRLRALAQIRLDTPYQFKAIGDGSGYEPDPFFRVDKTNCTVYVLTNMALASAWNYQQAESLMTYLNYYPGSDGSYPVCYENRRHFTSDRLITSEYFDLVTTSVAKPEELDTVRLVLNRQNDGSHFLPLDWEKEIELPFIPKKFITKKLLDRLPDVCGVGIVQKELFEKGIIIAHEGMLFDRKDFLHASKHAGKVVRENFIRYTRKKKIGSRKPLCDGMVVYLMKEVNTN